MKSLSLPAGSLASSERLVTYLLEPRFCAEGQVSASPQGQCWCWGPGKAGSGMLFLQTSQPKFADRTISTVSAPTALLSSRCASGRTRESHPQSAPSPRASPGLASRIPPSRAKPSNLPIPRDKANLRDSASNSFERWYWDRAVPCTPAAWWAHVQMPGLSRSPRSRATTRNSAKAPQFHPSRTSLLSGKRSVGFLIRVKFYHFF